MGRYEAQETRLHPGDRVIHRYTETDEDAEKIKHEIQVGKTEGENFSTQLLTPGGFADLVGTLFLTSTFLIPLTEEEDEGGSFPPLVKEVDACFCSSLDEEEEDGFLSSLDEEDDGFCSSLDDEEEDGFF